MHNETVSISRSEYDALRKQALLAEIYFEWVFRLQLVLAQILFKYENTQPNSPWWNLQWANLMGSIQAAFLHKARDLAGVDHEQFVAALRSGKYPNIDEIYRNSIKVADG